MLWPTVRAFSKEGINYVLPYLLQHGESRKADEDRLRGLTDKETADIERLAPPEHAASGQNSV